MDPNDENVRLIPRFSNPATASSRLTAPGSKMALAQRGPGGGLQGRRPLGDLTQQTRNQPFKVHPGDDKLVQKRQQAVLHQHHHHQPPPLKEVAHHRPFRHKAAPFVIHKDDEENKENAAASQFKGFPSVAAQRDANSTTTTTSSISSPSCSVSVTDFRQNVSISSVSSAENDDDNDVVDDDLDVMDHHSEDDSVNRELEGSFGALDGGGELVVCEGRLEAVPEAVLASHDYSADVLAYSRQSELKSLPKWNYMTKQSDITFPMRAILVDWLVEVSEEYNLGTETLYLAVGYIDRFLSFMSVQRAKLQLVGTSSMFIAAKYEEIYPPDLSEFVYITDDTYSRRQILKMEQLILGVLGFSVSAPTAFYFVNHFCQMSGCNAKTSSLAQYLSELTLVDGETYLCYLPSVIAASAVALARHTMGFAAWDESMAQQAGYSVEDFKVCLVRIHHTFTSARESPQQSIVEKYKQSKHHGVSNVEPTPIF